MDNSEIKRLNTLLEIYIDVNVDKYFSILSKNADSYFILNIKGQLVHVNEGFVAVFGHSKADLLQMRLEDLFFSSVLNESKTHFQDKDRETLTNFDTKIIVDSGKPVDVNVTTFPILFGEEVVGNYVVLKDISIYKRDSQLLSEKQAVAGQLAAGIAHEIRNPITAIKGFLQLMMGDHQGDKMYFEIVESEIDRVELILKELMVLAKPTKRKYEKIEVGLLVEQVLTLMESQALLNDIQVEKQIDFQQAIVLGDENQLKQVLINYIKNAIESMPDGGGKILIVGHIPLKGSVQIQIIDQGCGIPPDIIDRISEPFFTTKTHGTGLGMAVSYQIIEEHNGQMYINSSTDGTCIEVNLPMIS
jgi:two-component system, sporulation sensor kinase A